MRFALVIHLLGMLLPPWSRTGTSLAGSRGRQEAGQLARYIGLDRWAATFACLRGVIAPIPATEVRRDRGKGLP